MNDGVLYENIYKPTEEDISEFVANKLPDTSPVTALVCLVVIIITGLVWLQVIPADIIGTRPWAIFPLICLVGLIVYINVSIKKASLKKAISAYFNENANALDENRTFFYENHFVARGDSHEYSEISSVVYGASCLYIVPLKGQMVVVKDDSSAFIKGEQEKFWPFLEGKINMKVREKKKRTKADAIKLFRH